MPVREERRDEEAVEPSSDDNGARGRIWQSAWGLRVSLGLVALLVWVGATSASSSPSPASSSSVSPPVTTPVVAPGGPASAAPQAVDPPSTTNLPQQSLDITYDYGPGPQPVPGPSPAP
jgi:hypothetical protein